MACLKKCCYCCDISVGTWIISIIQIIFFGICLILIIINVVDIHKDFDNTSEDRQSEVKSAYSDQVVYDRRDSFSDFNLNSYQKNKLILDAKINALNDHNGLRKFYEDKYQGNVPPKLMSLLFATIVYLLAAISLIPAIKKRNHNMFLGYLIVHGIGFVPMIFFIFHRVFNYVRIMNAFEGSNSSVIQEIQSNITPIFIHEICFVSVILCLFIYMWIVVYSHYVVLKEENTRGGYGKARGEA